MSPLITWSLASSHFACALARNDWSVGVSEEKIKRYFVGAVERQVSKINWPGNCNGGKGTGSPGGWD